MIEVKIVLPPEIHELLKKAQALTGIARQDVAIGAFLAGDLGELARIDRPAGVASNMFDGLPRMMEVLGDEPVTTKPKKRRKAKPKVKAKKRKVTTPAKKKARKSTRKGSA